MTIYDVCIIGAGPSGLSAAIHSTSDGLKTVICADKIGGQIINSPKIENYGGFEEISGIDLINRMVKQAVKFGADFESNRITAIRRCNHLDGVFGVFSDEKITFTRSIILALGQQLNELDSLRDYATYRVDNLDYTTLTDKSIIVVGGGNSSGQFALTASQYTKRVEMIVRGSSLAKRMSRYLIDRIKTTPNINVTLNCEIESCDKVGRELNLFCTESRVFFADEIFCFVGYRPNTEWLRNVVELDSKGFIKANDKYETSTAGIFAVGDVMSNPVKRVSFAVGTGSAATSHVYRYLQNQTVTMQ